jgi:hypothetical protein
MNAFLTLISKIVAFGDSTPTQSPSLKFVDWSRSQNSVPVDNPGSESLTLGPQSATLIFDSSRTTLLDNTTQFALTLSTLAPDRYRFTYSSGTNPVLRLERVMATSGIALTLVANDNGTLTVTAGSGTPFANVVVGDTVFMPGVATGDADAGFEQLNQGEWLVLGRSNTVLTLSRAEGDFEGVSQTLTPGSNAMLAYHHDGVQVDDKVCITAGFSSSVWGTYTIVAVTSKWFEIESAMPFAPETAAPTAVGMAFFYNAQRYLRIESNRDCVVRVNGDTGNFNLVSPLQPGGVGHFEKTGLTWSLVLVNNSILPATVTIISAE